MFLSAIVCISVFSGMLMLILWPVYIVLTLRFFKYTKYAKGEVKAFRYATEYDDDGDPHEVAYITCHIVVDNVVYSPMVKMSQSKANNMHAGDFIDLWYNTGKPTEAVADKPVNTTGLLIVCIVASIVAFISTILLPFI